MNKYILATYWSKKKRYEEKFLFRFEKQIKFCLLTLVLSHQFIFSVEINFIASGILAFTSQFLLIPFMNYVVFTNKLSGWSYVNRQDIGMEVEYLSVLTANRLSFMIWSSLFFIEASPKIILLVFMLEPIIQIVLQLKLNHKSKYPQINILYFAPFSFSQVAFL